MLVLAGCNPPIPSPPPPEPCIPTTCAAQGASCGDLPDGCGGTLSCGSCSGGETCGGGGVAYVCGHGGSSCTPTTCAALHASCGDLPDGCGGTLSCGSCSGGETCGGGGVAHVCGHGGSSCTPTTCAAQGASCGDLPDGCGGTLSCGSCGSGKVCGEQHTCMPGPTLRCVAAQPPASLAPVTGNIRGQFCADGWCQSGPPPQASLTVFWALSDCDAWAAGELHDHILHWDGSAWSWVSLPVDLPVVALWGAETDDVWAFTQPPAANQPPVALHWDGCSWSPVALPADVNVQITGLSGASTSDVWAVAPELALHWDGTRWSRDDTWTGIPSDGLNASIQVFSCNDAIATTPSGCQRWNGAQWSSTPCTSGPLGHSSVWGSGPDDIWVIGFAFGVADSYHAVRSHWDGAEWRIETWTSCGDCPPSTQPPAFFSWVYGYGPDDVWINDTLHWDGRTWTKVRDFSDKRLAGRPDGMRFAFSNTTLFQDSGGEWKPVATVAPERILRIGGDSPGEVFGLGGPGDFVVYRYRHGAWRRTTDAAPFNCDPPGVCLAVSGFGHRPTDLWAFGGLSAWHWDGAAWTRMDFDPGVNIRTGWASSPDDALAVGGADGAQVSWHWDGTQWTRMTFNFDGDDIQKFWGSAADDLWAVGHHYSPSTGERTGVAWHWDGTEWTRVFSDAEHSTVFDISGSDCEVWALQRQQNVGTGGARVLRWNGDTFVLMNTVAGGENFPTNKLSVRGEDDVWVTVAPNWTGPFASTPVVHFDGSTWSPAGSIPGDLTGFHAVPDGDVFAADGRVFKRQRR